MSEKIIDLSKLENGDMIISADSINNPKNATNIDSIKLHGKEDERSGNAQKDMARTLSEPIFGDVKGVYTSDGAASSIAEGVIGYLYAKAMENYEIQQQKAYEKQAGEKGIDVAPEHNIESAKEINKRLTEDSFGGEERFNAFKSNTDAYSLNNLNQAFQEETGRAFKFEMDGNKLETLDLYQYKKGFDTYFKTSENPAFVDLDLKNRSACIDLLGQHEQGLVSLSSNDRVVLENYVQNFNFVQKTTSVRLLSDDASPEKRLDALKGMAKRSDNDLVNSMAQRGFNAKDNAKINQKIDLHEQQALSGLSNMYQQKFGNLPTLDPSKSTRDQVIDLRNTLLHHGADKRQIHEMTKYVLSDRDVFVKDALMHGQGIMDAQKRTAKAKGKLKAKIKKAMLKDFAGNDFYQGFQMMTTITKSGVRIVKSIAGGPMRKLGKKVGGALKKTKVYGKVAAKMRSAVRTVTTPFRAIGSGAKKVTKMSSSKIKHAKLKFKGSNAGKLAKKTIKGGKKAFKTVTKPFRAVANFLNKPKEFAKKLAAKVFKPFAKIGQLLSKVIGVFTPYIGLAVLAILLTGLLGPTVAKLYTHMAGDLVYPSKMTQINAEDFDKTLIKWVQNDYSERAYYKKINELCENSDIKIGRLRGSDEPGPSVHAKYIDYNIAYFDCNGKRLDGYRSNLKDVLSIVYAYIGQGDVNGVSFSHYESNNLYEIATKMGLSEDQIVTAYECKESEYLAMQYLTIALWEASNEVKVEYDDNNEPYIKWTIHYLTAVEMDKNGYPARYDGDKQIEFSYEVDGAHTSDHKVYTYEEIDALYPIKFYQSAQTDGKHGLCNQSEWKDGQGQSGCLLGIYTTLKDNMPTSLTYYDSKATMSGGKYVEGDVTQTLQNFHLNLQRLEAFTLGYYQDIFLFSANRYYICASKNVSVNPTDISQTSNITGLVDLTNTSYRNDYDEYKSRIWRMMDADWSNYRFYSPDAFYSETMTDAEIEVALKQFFNSDNFYKNYKYSDYTQPVDEVTVDVMDMDGMYGFRFAVSYWALKAVGNIPYYDIPDDFEEYLTTIQSLNEMKAQYDNLKTQYDTHFLDTTIKQVNSIYHFDYLTNNYEDILGQHGLEKFKNNKLPFGSTVGVIGSKNPGLNETELIWWIYESATSYSKYYYGNKPLQLDGTANNLCVYDINGTPILIENKQTINLEDMKPGDLLLDNLTGTMAIYIGQSSESTTSVPWMVIMSDRYQNASYIPASEFTNNSITVKKDLNKSITFTTYIGLQDIANQLGLLGQDLCSSDANAVPEFFVTYAMGEGAEVRPIKYYDGETLVEVMGVQAVDNMNDIVYKFLSKENDRIKYKTYLQTLQTYISINFNIIEAYGIHVTRNDLDDANTCYFSVYQESESLYAIDRHDNKLYDDDAKPYINERQFLVGVPYTITTNDGNGNAVSGSTTEYWFKVTDDGRVIVFGDAWVSTAVNVAEGYKVEYEFKYPKVSTSGDEVETGERYPEDEECIDAPLSARQINLTIYKKIDEEWVFYDTQIITPMQGATYDVPSLNYFFVTVEATDDMQYEFDGKIYFGKDGPQRLKVENDNFTRYLKYTIFDWTKDETKADIAIIGPDDCTIKLPPKQSVELKNTTGNFVYIDISQKDGARIMTVPVTPNGSASISLPMGDYYYNVDGGTDTSFRVIKDMELIIE